MKHCFCLVCLAYRLGNRHVVKESKQVLDSGFHAWDFGFQALDSSLCQWNLDFGFQSLWDSDFLSCFRDSKAQDSGSHNQSFPRELRFPRAKISRIPESKFPFIGQMPLDKVLPGEYFSQGFLLIFCQKSLKLGII